MIFTIERTNKIQACPHCHEEGFTMLSPLDGVWRCPTCGFSLSGYNGCLPIPQQEWDKLLEIQNLSKSGFYQTWLKPRLTQDNYLQTMTLTQNYGDMVGNNIERIMNAIVHRAKQDFLAAATALLNTSIDELGNYASQLGKVVLKHEGYSREAFFYICDPLTVEVFFEIHTYFHPSNRKGTQVKVHQMNFISQREPRSVIAY